MVIRPVIRRAAYPHVFGDIAQSLDIDFVNNYMIMNGQLVSRSEKLSMARSSTATHFDSAGVLQTAAANQLRIDHDPATGECLGALIEGARTNYCTYSEALSNWAGQSNVTVTDDAITVKGIPFSKVEATTSATSDMSSNLGAVGATEMVYSIKAKKGSGATDANRLGIYNGTTPGAVYIVSINWDTGAVTEIVGAANGETIVTDLGNGVWNVELRITSGINASDTLYVYAGFADEAATAGEYTYFSCAQLEAGKFATSYIKTEASAVARAADLLTLPTDGWYNPAGGTIYLEAASLVPDGGAGVTAVPISIGGTSYNEAVYLTLPSSSGFVSVIVRSGGSTEAGLNGGASVEGAGHKIAFVLSENDFAVSLDGAASVLDSAGAMPADSSTLHIGNGSWNGASNFFYGHIKRLIDWPARLPNATLEAMTA